MVNIFYKKSMILLLVLVIFSICFVGINEVSAAEEKIELGIAVFPSPRDHTTVRGMYKFKELVEERTNGEIKINVFHSGEMGESGSTLLSSAQAGTLEIANVTNPTLSNIEKKAYILDMPYLLKNREHADKVLQSGILDPIIKDIEENKRLKILTVYNETWRHIFNTKRPVYEPSDLNGLKLRVMESPLNVAIMEAMGGNPVPMAWGEVYLSLKNKTIDGVGVQINPVYTNSFYETGKYLSLTKAIMQQFWYAMNLDKFNSLSAEHQEILITSAEEAGAYTSKITAESEIEMIGELILNHGMTVNNVDTAIFEEATKNVYKKFDEVSVDLMNKIKELK